MVKKLEIRIGSHRDRTERAWVNDSSRPTVIDTPLFVGRVLVKIRDFDGLTPDGSPPIRDHAYFAQRSRRFDIQIEGKFKAREGVEPYRGDEIQFGSDFDHYVPFPELPFKLGMRVAKSIDPNTFYDFHPPSGRPYIMSPYLACMNTFAAWPSPSRYSDALVALQHEPWMPSATAPPTGNRPRSTSVQDMVPVEASRKSKKYWHFIGLRTDARIKALADQNAHLLPDPPLTEAGATPAKRPMPKHQISFGAREERDEDMELANRELHQRRLQTVNEAAKKQQKESGTPNGQGQKPAQEAKKSRFSSLTSKLGSLGLGGGSTGRANGSEHQSGESSPTRSETEDDVAPLPIQHVDSFPITEGIPELRHLSKGDLTYADALKLPSVNTTDPIEAQLGPWRFASDTTEPMEDNTFVFLDQSVPVPKRRKHFSKEAPLKHFTYDPDVIYSASFFSPFMDFNTFNLNIGPVHMNIAKWFETMPVRYTLRSSRVPEGSQEEEVFATISFQLVDA